MGNSDTVVVLRECIGFQEGLGGGLFILGTIRETP